MCCAKPYVGICAIVSAIAAVLCVVTAILAPTLIAKTVSDQAKEFLCVPLPTDDTTGKFPDYQDWRTNYNTKFHPAEIRKYYIYNLTNPIEYLSGATPSFHQIGPYTYLRTREKWAVNYSQSFDEVEYEQQIHYQFMANMSIQDGVQLSESDPVWFTNNPFVAALQLGNLTHNDALIDMFLPALCTSKTRNACLYKKLTVGKALWTFDSFLLHFLFTELFPTDRYALAFNLFFSCAKNANGAPNPGTLGAPGINGTACHDLFAQRHMFGLGGSCDGGPVKPFSSFGCSSPSAAAAAANMSSANLRSRAWTGRGDKCFNGHFDAESCAKSKLGLLSQWMGNSSVEVWPRSLPVQGIDQYELQFHPFVTKEETLRVWMPSLLRDFALTFKEEVTYKGIKLYRFTPHGVWNGSDGSDGFLPSPPGLLNALPVPMVRYGQPAPLEISQPHFLGADPAYRAAYACDNCGDAPTEAEFGTYLDIEPTTGKVLRGRASGQINMHLGQWWMPSVDPSGKTARLKDVVMPNVWYEDTAALTDGQAKLMRGSLSLMGMAAVAQPVLLYGGMVSAVLLFALTAFLGYRWSTADARARRQASLANAGQNGRRSLGGGSDTSYAGGSGKLGGGDGDLVSEPLIAATDYPPAVDRSVQATAGDNC